MAKISYHYGQEKSSRVHGWKWQEKSDEEEKGVDGGQPKAGTAALKERVGSPRKPSTEMKSSCAETCC